MSELQRGLADAAAKEHARKQKELYDKRVDTLIKVQSALFEKAQAYTRIIIGLGYAGFFGVWAGTRSHMPPSEMVWSALLVTLSLFFYVAYEVYQMIVLTVTDLEELSKLVEAPLGEFEHRHDEYKQKAERKNRDLMKVWYVALFLTVTPGLAGGVILVNAFIRFLVTK